MMGGGNESIRIGGVFLLSGVAQALGNASEAAVKTAIEVHNENGGIDGKDVEFIVRDHGENPTSTIKSLVQEENVDAMVGLTSSGVTLKNAPTIESLGVPFTLTDIGTPYITEFDAETYGNKAAGTRNIFRTNANTATTVYAIAKYAVENYDGARIANIGPGYDYGEQCWEYFKAYAAGLGGDFEYVASEFPDLGANDMTPNITAIVEADPEIVFTSFWGGDTVTFVTQASEQGLFEKVTDVFDTIGADPNVFSALGATMPEGLHFSCWYWHSAFDNDANGTFLDQYRERHSEGSLPSIPSFTGGSSYAAIGLYIAAIEEAGTDPDAMIDALEGMSYSGPRGEWTIDPDSHQASAPTVLGETSRADSVPYDGVGLANTEAVTLSRTRATELLAGSGLPSGL